MGEAADHLREAVAGFIESTGRDYAFPAGGAVRLLTTPEQRLVLALQSGELSDAERIQILSGDLDLYDSYDIVIFGIRLAILAVRRSMPVLFRYSVLAAVAGSPKIDWRDRLRAFACLQNCGDRLKLSFQSELQSMARNIDEESHHWADGFFQRTPDMQSIAVKGIVESGAGDEWTFLDRAW